MRLTLPAISLALVGTAWSSPALEPRQSFSGDTQNGLSGPCKAYTIIFARGTTEGGNVGAVCGPPFFTAVAKLVGAANLAVQGVPYPADIPGFLVGGDPTGSKTMASLIQTAITNCPQTKVIVSGYSQGAQLVHNSIGSLSTTYKSQIDAVVTFGDPDNGKAISGLSSSKFKSICHLLDVICMLNQLLPNPLVSPFHLNYGSDAGSAASWVLSLVSK